MSNPYIVAFARALIEGAQSVDACAARAAIVAGGEFKWVRVIAEHYVARSADVGPPQERRVVQMLFSANFHGFIARAYRTRVPRGIALSDAPPMQPVPSARAWGVPELRTTAAVAEWIGVAADRLLWLADARGMLQGVAGTRLHHYNYRVVPKRRGGVRIIESPKAELKAAQRRILAGILDRVPSYYDAAHGFVKGRSIRSFAAPHVGQAAVLRLDLQDFFPTVSRPRVAALFRTMGYPESVARLLAALCTNVTPRGVLHDEVLAGLTPQQRFDVRARYRVPHLPQGAPTSPSLANLCAFRLDVRLTGLADWAGAVYTRYADDLAISGGEEFARRAGKYALEAAAIASDEGWQLQHRKTRIMRRGSRQHLASLTVNDVVNVDRKRYDALKATLTNCIRLGPSSQNRDKRANFRAYLEGCVSFVESIRPARGERLRALLIQIDWEL